MSNPAGTLLKPPTWFVLGVVSSLVAGVCMEKASEFPAKWLASLVWLGAAAAIAARLFFRLQAARCREPGPLNTLYMELADPVADPWLFMAAGYCNDWVVKISGIPMGWVAAVLAVLAAFMRVLGWAMTGNQTRLGPMTCRNRLLVLIAACLGSIVELWVRQDGKCAEEVMRWSLALVVVGTAITCVRRIRAIAGKVGKA